jgi:predicted phosphoribosyltransferase
MPFADRAEAGRVVARLLGRYARAPGVVVLGLPRGGVIVAEEVARALLAPLDVFVVRKLGVPGFEELAFGAIAPGGVRVLNQEIVREAGLSGEVIDAVTAREAEELRRREREFRGGRAPLDVRGKTVVLVDDGLATGATVRAGVMALREMGPAKIVVAVPVGACDTCEQLARIADEVVCAATPEPFFGVGRWYVNFDQTGDEEVRAILQRQAPTSPQSTVGGTVAA